MARDAQENKESGTGSRDERLKAALRENLRRRKAQARGRAGTASTPEAPETAPSAENEREG